MKINNKKNARSSKYNSIQKKKNRAALFSIFLLQPVHIQLVPIVAPLRSTDSAGNKKKEKKCDAKKNPESQRKEKKIQQKQSKCTIAYSPSQMCLIRVFLFLFLPQYFTNQTYIKYLFRNNIDNFQKTNSHFIKIDFNNNKNNYQCMT